MLCEFVLNITGVVVHEAFPYSHVVPTSAVLISTSSTFFSHEQLVLLWLRMLDNRMTKIEAVKFGGFKKMC